MEIEQNYQNVNQQNLSNLIISENALKNYEWTENFSEEHEELSLEKQASFSEISQISNDLDQAQSFINYYEESTFSEDLDQIVTQLQFEETKLQKTCFKNTFDNFIQSEPIQSYSPSQKNDINYLEQGLIYQMPQQNERSISQKQYEENQVFSFAIHNDPYLEVFFRQN